MADNEAKILFPDEIVEIGGESFTVRPFGLGDALTAADILQDKVSLVQECTVGEGETANLDALMLFRKGGRTVIELLALVTGKPIAWFNAAPIDGCAVLLTTVIRMNKSFFVERVAAQIPLIMESIGLTPATPDGVEPSPISSPTDTAGQTSNPTPSTKSRSSSAKVPA